MCKGSVTYTDHYNVLSDTASQSEQLHCNLAQTCRLGFLSASRFSFLIKLSGMEYAISRR